MKEEQLLREVSSLVKEELPKAKLFLFGSRAVQKNDKNSDFDFLIDNSTPITQATLTLIIGKINELSTLYSVDITDAQSSNPGFIDSIKGDLKEVEDGKLKT